MTTPNEQPTERQPDEFEADLHPNPQAGQNSGQRLPEGLHTVYDIPDLHRSLVGFTDDELKRIPVVPPGTRLKQGAIYIDLMAPDRDEIKARGDMEAGTINAYVPKNEVDYVVFNRLRGIDNPDRVMPGDEAEEAR